MATTTVRTVFSCVASRNTQRVSYWPDGREKRTETTPVKRPMGVPSGTEPRPGGGRWRARPTVAVAQLTNLHRHSARKTAPKGRTPRSHPRRRAPPRQARFCPRWLRGAYLCLPTGYKTCSEKVRPCAHPPFSAHCRLEEAGGRRHPRRKAAIRRSTRRDCVSAGVGRNTFDPQQTAIENRAGQPPPPLDTRKLQRVAASGKKLRAPSSSSHRPGWRWLARLFESQLFN